jgi:Rrf2 family protein
LVPTKVIQQEMRIPRQMVLQVIAALARGGFVEAVQGCKGGIRLARPASQIHLREVITFFEGSLSPSECLENPLACPFEESCPVRQRWACLRTLILQELERTTLAELAAEAGPLPANPVD